MEVTTPLASLPYKEQVKKKQREVVIRIRIKSMRIRNPGFYYCILILAGDGSDYAPCQPALQGAGQEEAAAGRYPDPDQINADPKPWFLLLYFDPCR
jgi:hypothetical protein